MKFRGPLRRILFPPLPLIIILTLFSGAGLVYASLSGGEGILVYGIYTLSFYTLCTLVIYCACALPGKIRELRARVYSTRLGRRYKSDLDFRVRLTLLFSLAINLANVALNVIYGFVYGSRWFFILAFYYATLTVMRFTVGLHMRKRHIGEDVAGEWRRVRVCGFTMLLINLSLMGVVLMMMFRDRGFEYRGNLIYVMAAYAFYHVISASVNVVKTRRMKSPLLGVIREIGLASALVSMLSLETAMFSAFGSEMSEGDKRLFIALTGAAICITVTLMSVVTILRSGREIKKYGGGRESGKFF